MQAVDAGTDEMGEPGGAMGQAGPFEVDGAATGSGVIDASRPGGPSRSSRGSGDGARGRCSVAGGAREPIGVMLLISSLEAGGAERQVIELARAMDRRWFRPVICSLSDHVPLAAGLSDAVELIVVPKRWKFDVTVVTRVARILVERRIRIVHAFLFDAEMVGRLAGRIGRHPVVISSERNTDYRRPVIHTACFNLTRGLSDGWIANSHSGKRFLTRTMGIARNQIHVVHNGVDVEKFRPAKTRAGSPCHEGAPDESRAGSPCHAATVSPCHETNGNTVREELGIPVEDRVVGMVASFKRQKNHHHFFRMARQVLERVPNTWFFCVGEPLRDNQQGAEDYHREMRTLLEKSGLGSRCRLLGVRRDMPEVYNACDVTVLSSSREGTPNVLLESMACGVPVVATDVSDNAYVVPEGRAGFVVPLGDVPAMSERVCRLLGNDDLREQMGRSARAWVEEAFAPVTLAERTQAIYNELLHRRRVAQGGCVRTGRSRARDRVEAASST
ncbi:MAG: glycosyltransferase [Phycisphaerales bacterium]|nr:glycosyltransferase [Phycisphaerales bacterium]